jgi:hypothetical protein
MRQSVWILPLVLVTTGVLMAAHSRESLKSWWRGETKSPRVFHRAQILTADLKIKKLIKENLQDIEDCYNDRLEHGLNKDGDLKISWDINNRGETSHFQEMKNDLDDSELYDCSAEAISQWDFPKGQPFAVHYTFHLKQKTKPDASTAGRGIASTPPPEQIPAATNSQ